MNRLHFTTAVAALCASAATANAAFNYVDTNGNLEIKNFFWDSKADFFIEDAVNLDPYFTAPESHSFAFTSADQPIIDSWSVEYDGSSELTGTRFSMMSTSTISGALSAPLDSSSDFADSTIQAFGRADIEITETVEVEISFDFNAFNNEPGSILTSQETLLTLTSDLDAFADISAGIHDDANITSPFSFTTTLHAGDVVSAIFQFENTVLTLDGNQFFDQGIDAVFTIEVIPAPGATALFGLAGLTAARRRRTN